MRKLFVVLIAVLMIIFMIFTGCSNDNGSEHNQALDYDLLLQMPKSYVGIVDNVEYESLAQFKEEMFTTRTFSGAFAMLECVDTAFYVTIRHSGNDVMISGKAIAKCKITDIGEIFNQFSLEKNSYIDVEQDYYLYPVSEEDTLAMFESFGADFTRDSDGTIAGMEISDGDYLLEIRDNVQYELKLYTDVLPMVSGKMYTGAVISYDGGYSVQFLSPVETTDCYDEFSMSQSTLTIATAIKNELVQ